MTAAAVLEPALAPRTAAPRRWCIVTCEYPPHAGGVSDHTFQLVRALAEAGDVVDVWCPPAAGAPPVLPGVTVHVLPSHFEADALRVLGVALRALPSQARLLVQYVPTGYGRRMMNVPFAQLLFSLRARGLDLFVHEVAMPVRLDRTPRQNVAGIVHGVMVWLATRGARNLFVAIPAWQSRLARLGVRHVAGRREVTWVPVPSNVPDSVDPIRVRAIRQQILETRRRTIVGHFGTFGRFHLALLAPTIERILDDGADRAMLLIGRNGALLRDAIVVHRPDLDARITVTGELAPQEVSAHLVACDVLLQPYDDGISARRSTAMAGMALGKAIVSNRGVATSEPWTDGRVALLTDAPEPTALANAVSTLLADAERRHQLGRAARHEYQQRFTLEHSVAVLRGALAEPPNRASGPHSGSPYASLSTRYSVLGTGSGSSSTIPRVLMFHTTLPEPGRKLGGVEVAVHRLSNALVQLGVPVTVASLGPAPADALYQHRRLFTGARWLHDSRTGRLAVLPALLNGLDAQEHDVVHFHGDDWFTLRRPRATVRTLYGTALREAQHATRAPRRALQYLLYGAERLSHRLSTVTVALGRDEAELHGIERVIGCGVDETVFRPGAKSETPRLLYVGLWEGRKRGQWLYELFVERIAPRYPDAQLHFVADRAPPAHPQVYFTHFPDDATLARAYREAWIFALPSSYEGFGIPYLEAMASGTAVVATPNPGANELLAGGRFGVIADDAAYADALLALLRDPAERERVAAAGYERSREYAWSRIAREYLAVYREAIALRGGAPSSVEA
ncbi:MAG: glycosyltransferase family 4 protein [Gemmatimonadetes bacterium]|nr:glycosyltransferase family 4 protein [Gemmatimonadota bacterium]